MNPSLLVVSRTSPEKGGCPFFFLQKKNIIICVFCILISACTPLTLPPFFITEHPVFDYRNEKDLKMRISPSTSVLQPPQILFIAPIQWRDDKNISPELRRELEEFLREYFYQGLLSQNYFDMILTETKNIDLYRDMDLRLVTLEAAVTRIDKGIGLLRYFIGFGLGQSDLQVEGRLVENTTREEVMAFVMRFHHTGNAYNGWNPRALSGRYCLRMSMESVALTITGLIKDVWEEKCQLGTLRPLEISSMER